MHFHYLTLLAVLGLSLAQQASESDAGDPSCGPCDRSACPVDLSCKTTGRVTDPCGCCDVCAKILGERCGGSHGADGRCSDDYLCAGTSVYESVKEGKVGQCVCQSFESVCGTDGVVYEDVCSLKLASSERTRKGKSAVDVDDTDEMCLTPPVISSPPKDSVFRLGSQSELSCEAFGRPTPDIIWTKNGMVLPEHRTNLDIKKRNGPAKFKITSWTLITVSPDDSGVYTCTAKNSQGEVDASADVAIAEGEVVVNQGDAANLAAFKI